MGNISQRPQRFEMCIIKEGDLNMQYDGINQEDQFSPMFPVRVAMNN